VLPVERDVRGRRNDPEGAAARGGEPEQHSQPARPGPPVACRNRISG